MQAYNIVSLDMFQTLVSIDSCRSALWYEILGSALPEADVAKCWSVTSRHVLRQYHELTQGDSFIPMSSVFEKAFSSIFFELGVDCDPIRGAKLFTKHHGMAMPFDDTAPFLEHIGRRFRICVVTDADEDMLSSRLRSLGTFERIFSSGSLGAYKGDRQNRLFRAVVSHFGVPAEQILHVGDSSMDIIGASRVGIATCWLNRANRQWSHSVRPHYAMTSLTDIMKIL